ncbi:MAG: hypothetical protein K1X28_07935 [Parachlamydiales bacterium]|nr:hypothetical protein [Parachlamydiales bacterium]
MSVQATREPLLRDDKKEAQSGQRVQDIELAPKSVQKTSKSCREVFSRCCRIGCNCFSGLLLESIGIGFLAAGEGATMKTAGVLVMFLGSLFLKDAYTEFRNRR